MKFASLGSGSRGNAVLIQAGPTRVLLDCGFSVAQTEYRLARLGERPDELDAILISHEHTDHILGVAGLSRKYKLPVWLTAGTFDACRDRDFHAVHLIDAHQSFELGGLHVQAFPIPHDARDPCQFVFEADRWRLGVLTDCGVVTPRIAKLLNDCDALVLECNHDAELLQNGPYHASLKARITGGRGHLANHQAGALLAQLKLPRLQHLMAAHLSRTNNRPRLAAATLAGALGCEQGWVRVAHQTVGSQCCELC